MDKTPLTKIKDELKNIDLSIDKKDEFIREVYDKTKADGRAEIIIKDGTLKVMSPAKKIDSSTKRIDGFVVALICITAVCIALLSTKVVGLW